MAVPISDTLTEAERWLAELAGDLPSPDRVARRSAERIAEFFAGAARAQAYCDDVREMVFFKVRRDGGHVKVRVWAGQANSPGLCGELTMRPGEWLLLRRHLDADAVGENQCQIKYEGDVQAWLAEVA